MNNKRRRSDECKKKIREGSGWDLMHVWILEDYNLVENIKLFLVTSAGILRFSMTAENKMNQETGITDNTVIRYWFLLNRGKWYIIYYAIICGHEISINTNTFFYSARGNPSFHINKLFDTCEDFTYNNHMDRNSESTSYSLSFN